MAREVLDWILYIGLRLIQEVFCYARSNCRAVVQSKDLSPLPVVGKEA